MKRLPLFFISCLLLISLCACSVRDIVPSPPPLPTPAEESPAVETLPTPEPTPAERLYVLRLDAPYSDTPAFPDGEDPAFLPRDAQGFWRDESGDFVQLELYDGSLVWIHSWYLTAADTAEQQARDTAYRQARLSAAGFVPVEEFLDKEAPLFTCMAGSGLNCRISPSSDAYVVEALPFGSQVTVLGQEGDFYLCQLDDGSLVYCAAAYLSSEDSYVELEGAVDLRVYLPTLDFEMLFASPNNITGEAMYPAIPLLETSTAQMLARAQEIFRDNGYSIKLYDAYRPISAQYKLFDIVQDSRFIANPYKGYSWHQRGRAVDISLIDLATGEELEMPTPMHTFDTTACRTSSGKWTKAARDNVTYMTGVMTYVGFGTISTEWWHFENTAPGKYMAVDLDFSTLTYRPVSEWNA